MAIVNNVEDGHADAHRAFQGRGLAIVQAGGVEAGRWPSR